MRKSNILVVLAAIIVLTCVIVVGVRIDNANQARIDELSSKQEELLKTQEGLENSVKDLEKKNTDLDGKNKALINEISELKSKLTDQLQEMKRQKEEYENQLKEKDKQIAAVKQAKLVKIASNTSKTMTLEATAYTARCKGCSGFTALGLDIRNSTPKIIAVDPKVIPLGSKVEVFVDGKSWGIYTAGDTGGAIKGHKADVLMATKQEAKQFGRRDIKVRIVEVPKKKVAV